MKKLLFILLLPTVLFAQLELPFPVKVVNPKPLDFWYYESDGTPYDNTTEAITQVISAVRFIGMTVNVNGVEYWWKDSTADIDLVAKGGSTAWGDITGKPTFFPADTTLFWKTNGTSTLDGEVTIDAQGNSINIGSTSTGGLLITVDDFYASFKGINFLTVQELSAGNNVLGLDNSVIGIGGGGGAYAIKYDKIAATPFLDIQPPSGTKFNIRGPASENVLSFDEFFSAIRFGDTGIPIVFEGLAAPATETYAIVVDDAGTLSSQAIGGSSYTDEEAQDAVGAMVDATLVYNDGTPSLSRAALTGAITASAGSNTTALGSFTKAALDAAVSDGNVLYVGDVTTNATHTGDVTGATVLTIANGAVDIPMLSATGTPSASTFLRGDNTWATVSGSGDMLAATYDPANIAQQVVGTTATQTVLNKNISTGSSWTGNQIGATYGGTGQVSYTAGDILYAAGASSLLKLNIGTTGQVLTVSGGALPVWQTPSGGGGGLTYAQSKALKFK